MDQPSRFACVVGAPRSGTTSLAGFLQDHPDIGFSFPKEPHFFSRHDLSALSPGDLDEAVEEYLARYFPHRRPGQWLAEGSVSYLYAADRMGPILRTWPEAKFIIAVRDPMAMLPSLHQRLLYTGDESVEDFSEAWRLTGERRAGRRIPRTCIDPRLLYYDEAGRLGTHVERFFGAVGRERCFVALFDDLTSDPGRLYRELMEFLGLPPRPEQDFAPRRSSSGYKLGWLQRLLKRPPVVTRKILAGEKFRQRVKHLNGNKPDSPAVRAILRQRKRLLSWNKAPSPPVRIDPQVRAEIRERLAGEIDHLSELLGRDLGHWLGRRTVAPASAVRPADHILV